ncbi:MAG TPA: aminoacyl-tRNA hydrolase [Stellaceae bacterium]|jgi:peptidyl-tRNA hydrolase, PTH1 family|nr:aminoacyl-tRNA hydrolase [Stellaceae bacterium]
MSEIPLLIAGLGNPGDTYARHRHNVGFMAADAIAAKHRFGPWRARYHGLVSEGVLKGRRTILLKPMTYMNESGRAVGDAARYLKIPPAAVVAIHDELDLVPGKLRAKAGGGDAGHNGLRSITATLGPDYRRVRIGIGHPGAPELVHPYVLHDFSKTDREWLAPLLDAIAEAAPYLAANDDPGFMNRVALLTKPPKPPKPKTEQKPEEKKDGI